MSVCLFLCVCASILVWLNQRSEYCLSVFGGRELRRLIMLACCVVAQEFKLLHPVLSKHDKKKKERKKEREVAEEFEELEVSKYALSVDVMGSIKKVFTSVSFMSIRTNTYVCIMHTCTCTPTRKHSCANATHIETQEDEIEGRPSDLSDDLYSSSDDDDREMWAERRKEQQKKRQDKEPAPAPKFYEIKPGMDFWPPTMPRKTSSK